MNSACRFIIVIAFIFLLFSIHILYWLNPISFYEIIALHDQLLNWINEHDIISAILYIATYILSIIFGIPISVTIIGGYFFGIIAGIIYSMLGFIVGTLILCSLVRYVIGDCIQKRYNKQLEPFNKEIKKYGLHYIIITHMIPFMPSFLPHIATGISTMPLSKIILFNIIGAFPLTCLYTIAGAYIHEIYSLKSAIYYMGIFGGILGLFFLLALAYKRFFSD